MLRKAKRKDAQEHLALMGKSKEFRALKDYRSFADAARATYHRILKELQTQDLGKSKREVVYSFGAAEGLLLNGNPRWKGSYFDRKFDLHLFYPALSTQAESK